MPDVATVVDGYFAMWNELDPERRRSIIGETFTEDATYLDPNLSGDGRDGIDAMVAAVQAQYPGHRFELAAGPDAHHDCARFAWRMLPNGSDEPVAEGVDFITLAADGRLRAVTGFMEPAAT